MPLVRVEVRNEYALGAPELYREANKEDPKEILEGVAVAGLVGVLRQLGDLAEFAAEVFHGLQEEVMRTSSRSHKLVARVQRIETALSPLEKALLAQRSHLHFAYTAGSNWHARIKCEQNHFVYSDVPQFIMDSYDDSRGPPSLHLLDRFDTGGPGSCVKRYSDPTFFKRASVASGEASAERTSKDKKGRKIKKRRSWTRSREVSRNASFSYNSGSMRFSQMNGDGHSSPSQTASTYDATQRSDLTGKTASNLRNGPGYVETVFRPNNSVQREEQESRESISSSVKRRESDFLDYNFLEGKITDEYDDIQIYPSQEQVIGCSSSSVTWDEKNETLKPTTHDSDNEGNRHLESFSPDLDLETLGHTGVDFENVDKMDIQPIDDQAVPAPESGDAHLVDFENVDKMDIHDQAVPAPESGDAHLDDIESETDSFMDALNTIESECETETDCTKKQEAESIRQNLECQPSSSESNVLTDPSLINGICGDNNPVSLSPKSIHATNSNRDADSLENYNTDKNVDSSNFGDDRPEMSPITEGTSPSLESQKYIPETSNVTSVTFWTNGGLLGLQPSKPPDWSISKAPQDPSQSDQTENSKHIEEDLNTDTSTFRKTLWKIPPADLDIKLGKLGERVHQNNYAADILPNKKPLLGEDQNRRAVAIRTFSGRNKDLFGGESPIFSPASSPPLAHMKISFQPIDGFETSKLKLKFPNGNTNSNGESVGDIFPSFQLVPEVSINRAIVNSDSDADTFYRSSPSLSDDDSHSNQSESNSEQWESSESPTSKDRDLYDALRRVSLAESVSTVSEKGLQFPFVENGSFRKELRNDIVSPKSVVGPAYVPTPAPPPLPPVQWQVMMFDHMQSASTISQPKPAPINVVPIDTVNVQKSKSNLQKSNGQREVKQGKSVDVKDDFLHQIRTKSFNLRPTLTTKPTVPSGGSTNVQVTAILEKANAIRQAVGSDGEDDGNWSEA
ncbi:protein scar3 [Phtheirospermum japonicum]|uniref:Protein SCAR n=1 Tax=Phtheirospermum japonicum TaxID=374723 RepID=A0A830C617_9LAMI|nr:protein scar3 [Phtheirospermum japonicum]